MKENIKKNISIFVLLLCMITTIPASASAPNGIKNNGLGGIYIDINSAPYTTFATIPTWGQYAYGTEGCAWFASARVNQLTGKGSTIYSGQSWYNSQYANYNFSRGQTPQAGALMCWSGHVAVLEKINGDTAYISEGGYISVGASYGYCAISTESVSNLSSHNGLTGFLGYVYLGTSADTTPSQINWPDVSAGTSSTNTVISWSAATNATDYDVYIYKQGSSSYYHFGNTTSTSYSIILPAGTYEVEVVACNKTYGTYAGNAHRTTFTVTEAMPPKVTLNISAGTSDTPTVISWNKSDYATDYDVYIFRNNQTAYSSATLITVQTLSYSIQLDAGEYAVEVIACNKNNNGNVYQRGDRVSFIVTDTQTEPSITTSFTVTQYNNYAEITNNSEYEYTPTIIVAEYDNSILQGLSSAEVSFSAGEKRTIMTGSGQCKVFVWDSLKGMRPLDK